MKAGNQNSPKEISFPETTRAKLAGNSPKIQWCRICRPTKSLAFLPSAEAAPPTSGRRASLLYRPCKNGAPLSPLQALEKGVPLLSYGQTRWQWLQVTAHHASPSLAGEQEAAVPETLKTSGPEVGRHTPRTPGAHPQ